MQYVDIYFLIGRILLGGFFLMKGLSHFMKPQQLVKYAQSKGLPAPAFMVFIAGLFLLLGSLGILLGTYIQWAVLLLVLFLLVVSFAMHGFWSVQDSQAKMREMTFFMSNIALIGALLMILMIQQPWLYSIGS